MIGYILLATSILLYIINSKKWSLLLFLSFVSKGFCFLPDEIIGVKNLDLAFIYTFVVILFSLFTKDKIVQNKWLTLFILLLFCFLLCSAFFSHFYYSFSALQILQGGRHLFLFLGYFIIIRQKRDDLLWLIKIVYVLTVISSILYAIQVVTGWGVLPYGEAIMDEITGVWRYYNSPLYLPLCIYITIFAPNLIKIPMKKVWLVVMIIAQILTLGRLEIATTLFIVIIGFLFQRKPSTIIASVIILFILSFPMSDLLISRYTSETYNSESDIETIFNGGFKEMATGDRKIEGTLSYRFAWVYERYLYLKDRPFAEKMFGLGMISDSQYDLVLQRYNFRTGLINQESNEPTQLETPDIAYGNLLTKYGYLGSIILLAILCYMIFYSYAYRNDNPYYFILFLLMTGYMIRSLSGSIISSTSNLIMPFILFTLALKNQILINSVRTCTPSCSL